MRKKKPGKNSSSRKGTSRRKKDPVRRARPGPTPVPPARKPCPDGARLLHLNPACLQTLQELIDLLPSAVFFKDRSLHYVTCNRAYADRLGKSPSEVIGRTDEDLLPREMARKRRHEEEHFLKAGVTAETVEGTVVNGRETWFQVTRVPYCDERGALAGLFGAMSDITSLREATQERYRNAERYQSIVENLNDGLLIHDFQGRILDTNDQTAAITGYTRAELLGMNVDQLAGRHQLQETLGRQQESKEGSLLFETEALRKDGRPWVASISSRIVSNEHGGRVQSFIRDISNLRNVELAIRRTSDRFRNVVESSPMGIHMYQLKDDGSLIFIGANDSADRILKTDNRRFVGLPILEAFPSLAGSEVPDRYRRAARNGESWQTQSFTYKDGVINGAFDVYAFQTAPGEMAALFIDITERLKSDTALRESEAHFRAIVDQAALGIVKSDLKGVILDANPAFLSMTGYALDELRGLHVEKISDPSHDLEKESRYVRDVVAGREHAVNYVKCYRRKDGSPLWCSLTLSVVRNADGQPLFLLGLLDDITLRRKQEEVVQRLATAMDQIDDGLMILDLKARIQYVNRSFERITGYKASDVVGSNPSLLGTDARATERFYLETVLPRVMTGQPWRGRQVLRLKDGSERFSESILTPIHDPQGRIVSLISTVRDITEQVKQEAQVLRLASAIEQVDEAVFITDVDQIIRYVNPAFEKVTGYPPTEAVGKSPHFLVPPEIVDEVFQSMADKVLAGENWTGRFLNLRKDGTLFTAEASISTVKDREGRPINAVTIMRDITDQLKAEEDMLRLASAFDQAGDAIMILDGEENIQFVNPAFERITGYPRNEAVGRNPAFLVDPGTDPTVFGKIEEKIHSGQVWSGRFRDRRKDGTLLEAEVTVSPVRDSRGRLINRVVVLRDVTEEIAMQDRLQQMQKMEAIGQLSGGIAHDFNNLLAPILGYVQILMQKVEPGHPCLPDLKEIEKAAYRGRDLSRRLLSFSRKQVVEMHSVDLTEVLDGFQRILRRTLREDIELRIFPKASGRLKADTSQIELVLMNLVINAQDAMPKGGVVTLETQDILLDADFVKRHPGSHRGPHVQLSVTDTGCGMTPEQTPHIFEPFYTTKSKDKGTGLGLTTVYGIVQQHHGNIWVYTEPGRGTSFKVFFPRLEEDGPGASEAPATAETAKENRGHENILLVEDDEGVRSMVQTALMERGYRVTPAALAREALDKAEQDPSLHLLLTDVILPGMNGPQLHRLLEEKIPGLRVIYMSGYTENTIAHHGVLEEGVHFLQKPFTLEDLAAKVRQALDAP